MKSLFIFLVFFLTFIQSYAQNCTGGAPPTSVTLNMAGWTAYGGPYFSTNTYITACGFPPNSVITGYHFVNVLISHPGVNSHYCSDFSLYFNWGPEPIDDPNTTFTISPAGTQQEEFADCVPESSGDIGAFQFDEGTYGPRIIKADQSGCIQFHVISGQEGEGVEIKAISGTVTFYACPAGEILPIILDDLDAYASGKENVISWKTSVELNTNHITLQKSDDSFSHWTDLEIFLSSNSNTDKYYKVTDKNPYKTTYYRVKTEDFDGSIQYSDIVSVKNEYNNFRVFSIQPNPSSSFISVDMIVNHVTEIRYNIFNSIGKNIAEGNFSNSKIDISQFRDGLYYLKINNVVNPFVVAKN